jgi:hypothetical protein
MTSMWTEIIFLNTINQMIFVMVKSCVLFEVRTEFLNVIYTSFGFRGLRTVGIMQTVELLLWTVTMWELWHLQFRTPLLQL